MNTINLINPRWLSNERRATQRHRRRIRIQKRLPFIKAGIGIAAILVGMLALVVGAAMKSGNAQRQPVAITSQPPATDPLQQPLTRTATETFGVTEQDVTVYHMDGNTFRVTVKKDGTEYTVAVGVMVEHKQLNGGER